jgi:hypothetical protein
MTLNAGVNTIPKIGLLRLPPRHVEPEAFPVGCIVRTPTGRLAIVERTRGNRERGGMKGRDHLVRIVCRYTDAVHRDEALVPLAPALLVIVSLPS